MRWVLLLLCLTQVPMHPQVKARYPNPVAEEIAAHPEQGRIGEEPRRRGLTALTLIDAVRFDANATLFGEDEAKNAIEAFHQIAHTAAEQYVWIELNNLHLARLTDSVRKTGSSLPSLIKSSAVCRRELEASLEARQSSADIPACERSDVSGAPGTKPH